MSQLLGRYCKEKTGQERMKRLHPGGFKHIHRFTLDAYDCHF